MRDLAMRKMKKLSLGRDTLRILGATATGEVAGGTSALTFSCACSGSPNYTSGCSDHGGTNNSCGPTHCYQN